MRAPHTPLWPPLPPRQQNATLKPNPSLLDSPPPAVWWQTPESDLALLIGAWRHGVGGWAAVRRDPELAHAFPVSRGSG